MPLPKEHPIMQAWFEFMATKEYELAKSWASDPNYVEGALWSAFLAGRESLGVGAGRGSGRTTKQLLEAPTGSIFVWCEDSTGYPRDLIKRLKRADISIMGRKALRDGGHRLAGAHSMIILDHAIEPIEAERNIVAWIEYHNGKFIPAPSS